MTTLEELQEKTQAGPRPVLVDFWAPWCAPCRQTGPILEKLAGEFEGRVDFLAVNADDSGEVMQQYKVLGIPTVLAFLHGQEAGRVVGARSENEYRKVFEALSEGRAARLPMGSFDRMLRLGGGTMLLIYGVSTGNWLVVAVGGLLVLLGVYDLIPGWQKVARLFKRKQPPQA